jgi:hypothetical protein
MKKKTILFLLICQNILLAIKPIIITRRGHCGRDRIVARFITTYVISAYRHNAKSSNPAQAGCTRYNILCSSLSVTCDRSVVFFGYFGFLHQ